MFFLKLEKFRKCLKMFTNSEKFRKIQNKIRKIQNISENSGEFRKIQNNSGKIKRN